MRNSEAKCLYVAIGWSVLAGCAEQSKKSKNLEPTPAQEQVNAPKPDAPPLSEKGVDEDADPITSPAAYRARLHRAAVLRKLPRHDCESLRGVSAHQMVDVLDSGLQRVAAPEDGWTLVRTGTTLGWLRSEDLERWEGDAVPTLEQWQRVREAVGDSRPMDDCDLQSIVVDLDQDGAMETVVWSTQGLSCREAVGVFRSDASGANDIVGALRTHVVSDLRILEFAGRAPFLAIEEQWVQESRWTGTVWSLYSYSPRSPGRLTRVFQTTTSAIDARRQPSEYLRTRCVPRDTAGTGEWNLHCLRTVQKVLGDSAEEQSEESWHVFDGQTFQPRALPAQRDTFEPWQALVVNEATGENSASRETLVYE